MVIVNLETRATEKLLTKTKPVMQDIPPKIPTATALEDRNDPYSNNIPYKNGCGCGCLTTLILGISTAAALYYTYFSR